MFLHVCVSLFASKVSVILSVKKGCLVELLLKKFPLRRKVLLQGWLTKKSHYQSLPSQRDFSEFLFSMWCQEWKVCCRRHWDRNAGPGRLCLYLSLCWAAETLTCPCHAGILFLRPHLPPCCLWKHFRVPNLVGRSDKHMWFSWKEKKKQSRENELCFARELKGKSYFSHLGHHFYQLW